MVSQRPHHASARRGISAISRISHTIVSGRQWSLAYQDQSWRPPTDVYETDDSIVVKLEVAGMSEDDFEITFADRTLMIRGARHDPSEKVGYHQMEISYGEFRTDIDVPLQINADGIEASYHNGFLLITMPKVRRSF